MRSLASCLLLLLAVAGCQGCFSRSASTTRAPPIPTTPIPPEPVVEEHIAADSRSTVDRGNAWNSGGGIDWTHVGSGGHASGSNRGTTSNSGSRRGSSGSTASGGSTGSSGPTTPQSVSRGELRILSKQLYELDTNSVGSMIEVNTQGRTTASGTSDNAPQRLLAITSPGALEGPTISALWSLLDNYQPSVTLREEDTTQEQQEQENFLTAVMATEVMAKTEEFLRGKGFIQDPLRAVLKELWFTSYTRSRRTVGSSGFEHVFVGESKSNKVSGFHNWVSFYKEEQEGDLNYYGYMKTQELGDKASLILLKFKWARDSKPVGSMFVGTSPELEMALYTVCFYARPGASCPIEMNRFRFSIQTYYQNYNGKKYIGTSYPNF